MVCPVLSGVMGQYPYLQLISSENNFGNSNITCLLEDHSGIIWAGTELGLMRFDVKQKVGVSLLEPIRWKKIQPAILIWVWDILLSV
ncbi:MAG: two-component regulator propeller domain-containing protein [Saprospiraceae bacterium]